MLESDDVPSDSLTNGCTVELKGSIQPSPGRGQTVEMHVSEVIIHGECDAAVSGSFKIQVCFQSSKYGLHAGVPNSETTDDGRAPAR